MYSNRLLSLIAILLLFFSVSCQSKEVIPFAFSDKGWHNQKNTALSPSWLKFGSIKLNITSFSDIQEIFGKAEEFRISNENYSPSLLCYINKDDQIFVFQSGPLGGWSTVTSILITNKNIFFNKECIESNEINNDLNIGKISIGFSKKDVLNLLNKPTFEDENIYIYRFEHLNEANKVDSQGGYVITSGIEVYFNSNDEVEWYRVYSQESK